MGCGDRLGNGFRLTIRQSVKKSFLDGTLMMIVVGGMMGPAARTATYTSRQDVAFSWELLNSMNAISRLVGARIVHVMATHRVIRFMGVLALVMVVGSGRPVTLCSYPSLVALSVLAC